MEEMTDLYRYLQRSEYDFNTYPDFSAQHQAKEEVTADKHATKESRKRKPGRKTKNVKQRRVARWNRILEERRTFRKQDLVKATVPVTYNFTQNKFLAIQHQSRELQEIKEEQRSLLGEMRYHYSEIRKQFGGNQKDGQDSDSDVETLN